MINKKPKLTRLELERIAQRIERVMEVKHGEVCVKIQNGAVHRVLSTEDEMFKKTEN